MQVNRQNYADKFQKHQQTKKVADEAISRAFQRAVIEYTVNQTVIMPMLEPGLSLHWK